MGRQARPWPRAGRTGWWTKAGGKFIRLGDTEREAWVELHRLEARKGQGAAPGARLTVPELVDLWLDSQQDHIKPPTWRNNRKYGESFARHCRKVLARELKPLHVRAWLKAHPEWVGCKGLAIATAKQATRWGRREGWLEVDPLADLKGIPAAPRKPAPDGAAEKLPVGIRSEAFRQIFEFMLATGVRPGEVRTLEATQIDLRSRVALVCGKKGERPVLLPESLLEPIRALCQRHTSGPIFRNTKGKPWSDRALSEAFRRARKLADAGEIVAYHTRGIFASRAHAAGVDGVTIASLLGHKDLGKLKVLIRNYLSIDEAKLRDGVEKAQPKP